RRLHPSRGRCGHDSQLPARHAAQPRDDLRPRPALDLRAARLHGEPGGARPAGLSLACPERVARARRPGAGLQRPSTTVPLTLTLTVVRPSAIGIGAADSATAARAIISLGIGSGWPPPESPTEIARTVQPA